MILIVKIQAVKADLASGFFQTFRLILFLLFIDLTIWALVGSQLMYPFPRFCSLAVSHVCTYLFSLSLFLSDFMVKVVEVSDSSQTKTLRGHEAPVLSVAFDPKDDFLVGKPSL